MGKLRMLAISLIGTGLFASCSASSDSADLVELTTTSTIATTTIAQPSSSTTEASTTTSQAQTTTSEATPTTTLEELTAEIEADLQAGREVATAMAGSPADADLSELNLWFAEPLLSEVTSAISRNAREGIAWRPGPGRIDTITVESVTPLGDRDALVVYCLANDSIIYRIDTNEVINDEVLSFRYSASAVKPVGRWKLADTMELGVFEGPSCG